jgi:dimethylargininase
MRKVEVMATNGDTRHWGGHTVVGTLRRVLVFPPVPADNSVSWQEFGYLRPLDHGLAVREHETFRRILREAGAEVITGEIDNAALQDAIFPFDPAIITDAGAILCRMGKDLRRLEVDLAEETMRDLGIPIIGRITEPGMVEGGDCLWIDQRTLAVGRGYRTNEEGIRQLAELLRPQGVEVLAFDLPHWHGPDECLHLLTMISMVDDDLAVVYLPLMATSMVQMLHERGIRFVEVPEEEFASQGPNVLALGPRRCLLLEENEVTTRRLRDAGCEVTTYRGLEISHNRTGGPTCLTRPLLRDVAPAI